MICAECGASIDARDTYAQFKTHFYCWRCENIAARRAQVETAGVSWGARPDAPSVRGPKKVMLP